MGIFRIVWAWDPLAEVRPNTDEEDCDVAFYGLVFERARGLADRAASQKVPIVTESQCQTEVSGLVWEPLGPLAIGRLVPSKHHPKENIFWMSLNERAGSGGGWSHLSRCNPLALGIESP